MGQVSYSITKNKLLIAMVITALIITVLFWFINVKAIEPWTNCAQIYASTGRKDITKGDKLYNPAMDRNKNGISCE